MAAFLSPGAICELIGPHSIGAFRFERYPIAVSSSSLKGYFLNSLQGC